MKAAVSALMNAEIGYKEALNKSAVLQTTLERYAKKKTDNPGGSKPIYKQMGRIKCVFNEDRKDN
jgi:hypothetical protein